MFVRMPQQAAVSDGDLPKVRQGLLAGVGFLGAGTIVNGSGEAEVKGLTTVAGIWRTATIGVAAGMGEATTVLSALLALILYTVPRSRDWRAVEDSPDAGTSDERREHKRES